MNAVAKGYLITFLAIVLFLVLQTTLLGSLRPKPDGVLAVVLAVSFLRGPYEGAIVGFAGGLMEDGLSGVSMGSFCATYLLAGLLAGAVVKRLNASNLLVLLVGAVLGCILQAGLFRVAVIALGLPAVIPSWRIFAGWILLQGLICAGFLPLLRIWFTSESIRSGGLVGRGIPIVSTRG